MRFLIFVTLLFIFTQTAFAAVVSRNTGKNQIKKAGEDWKPLSTWASVDAGDRIKTGLLGLVHVKFYENVIKISPNTELLIENLTPGEEPMVVVVQSGFAWSSVKNLRSSPDFKVKTPTAVAGIRGTKFGVGESSDDSLFCVCEGIVRVTCNIKDHDIGKGICMETNKGDMQAKNDYGMKLKGGRATKSFKEMAEQRPLYKNCLQCHDSKETQYDWSSFNGDFF